MMEILRCKNEVNSDNWMWLKAYPAPKLREILATSGSHWIPYSTDQIMNEVIGLDTLIVGQNSLTTAQTANRINIYKDTTALLLELLLLRYGDSHCAGDSFIPNFAVFNPDNFVAPKIHWVEYDVTWKNELERLIIEVAPQFTEILMQLSNKYKQIHAGVDSNRDTDYAVTNTSRGPNINTTYISDPVAFVSEQLATFNKLGSLETIVKLINNAKDFTIDRILAKFSSLFTKNAYKEQILFPIVDTEPAEPEE